MAVRSIIYNEGNPNSYESVEIHIIGKEKKLFSSGNLVKDWFDANKWWIHSDNVDSFLINSSSCDHFISDGAEYDPAYLNIINNQPYLDYSYIDDAVSFFVKKGTQPTWETLKKMCDDV